MNKYLLLLFGVIFSLMTHAEAGISLSKSHNFYAFRNGDTLRIGNSLIERTLQWNGGNPLTQSLIDKASGGTLQSVCKKPDFLLVEGTATEGEFQVDTVPANAIHEAYLEAKVSFRMGDLQVERRYRIYDDCPAIACDTYIKGKAAEGAFVQMPTIEHLQPGGKHWQTQAVEFHDVTDSNDNLVEERSFVPYRRRSYRGNLLYATNLQNGTGILFLKEAPCSDTQLHYPGADFELSAGDFAVVGPGISPEDISEDKWTRCYGCVTGIYQGGEYEALAVLRKYQKQLRRVAETEDEMIMMNTWGDRSQDSRINEAFCLEELERCARLGVNVFQLDDGWESGKSPNSKQGGSFKDIWKQKNYWEPDPEKFPRGFSPIVEKGRQLGIRIGLWFNPSIQDEFADWEKDATTLIGLHRRYGICIFKIDGLQIPSKRAEQNLRSLFDMVSDSTGHQVIFNLDATAGQRGGYYMLPQYGNIFLENRYTDWGNYYPFHTLRNLWQLARYVPAEKIQIEFLNPWRNAAKYAADDPFAPKNYSFEYLFAITMAAQPLAWMEAQNLPEEAYQIAPTIRAYASEQHHFHQGHILPIGEEPSGRSWTGFQSILNSNEGYFIVYRENTPRISQALQTWLPGGKNVSLQLVAGDGNTFQTETDADGRLTFHLPEGNSFAFYRYRVNASSR